MAKKTIPISQMVRILFKRLSLLEEYLPKIMSQKFWEKQVPVKEKTTYIEAIANTRNKIFVTAENENPEIKGKNYSIENNCIEYEE